MKILITSGGTKIKIDRVRDITNMSSGTFGSRIATEYLKLNHNVVFMKARGSKTPMSTTIDLMHNPMSIIDFKYWEEEMKAFQDYYTEYEYTTYEQYAEMLKFVIGVEKPDMILLAAAVSDYGVENVCNGKLRSNDMLTIKLCQLPKLINRVKEWAPNAKLIGFKLLVDSKDSELIDAAKRSITENDCDMVVANDLRDIKDNNHIVHLVTKKGVTQCHTGPSTAHDKNMLARMVVRHSLNEI